MLEEFDGEMIEIGDPTEEPAAAEPPTRVVIEYRERGVPWMLVPPLLVISAAGAILAYHKLVPPAPRAQPRVLVKAPDLPIVPEAREKNGEPADPIKPPTPAVEPNPAPSAEKLPFDMTPGAKNSGPAPVAADPPASAATSPIEPPLEPAREPDPAPFPRVQGLGFDPKALEAGSKPEAPADRALAPAGQEGRPDDPGRGMERIAQPDPLDQPKEVDPDLLPPDPRLAQERRARRLAEFRQMVEADRGRFFADLKGTCRKYRDRSGPEIVKLVKQYDSTVDPAVKQKAAYLLGPTGPYVGVDRAERINLLRALGYPEPAILANLFVIDKSSIGERDGPRDEDELIYLSAVFLLRHPPAGVAPASRPVSSAGPATGANAPTSRAIASPGSAR